MDFRPPVTPEAPIIFPEASVEGLDIPPGAEVKREYRLPGSPTVTQQQVNAISGDAMRLYVLGCARYLDVFGNERLARWCYEHSRETGKFFDIVPAYHKMG